MNCEEVGNQSPLMEQYGSDSVAIYAIINYPNWGANHISTFLVHIMTEYQIFLFSVVSSHRFVRLPGGNSIPCLPDRARAQSFQTK